MKVKNSFSKFIFYGFITAVTFFHSQTGKAQNCDVGREILASTMQGTGAGIAIGGIVMLIQINKLDRADIFTRMGTAAIIGAGMGLGIGLIEGSLCMLKKDDDTSDNGKTEKSGLETIRPILLLQDKGGPLGVGVQAIYNF